MINKKFLLIVEGKVTEPSIFKTIFERYGFKVNIGPQMPLTDFNKEEYILDNSEVNILQGPKNRISELLRYYKLDSTDLQKIFKECSEVCSGIFIIYDVDHTSNDDLEELSKLFQDEMEGLLLVSSPCIEVLADVKRTAELKCNHLSEYKSSLNTQFDLSHHVSAKKYIENNFEKLAVDIIDKNVKELGSSNIMEHPQLVIDYINKNNIRINEKEKCYVIYRYFTTVIYVAVAYILGLTKEIDNAEIVKNYFKQYIKSN